MVHIFDFCCIFLFVERKWDEDYRLKFSLITPNFAVDNYSEFSVFINRFSGLDYPWCGFSLNRFIFILLVSEPIFFNLRFDSFSELSWYSLALETGFCVDTVLEYPFEFRGDNSVKVWRAFVSWIWSRFGFGLNLDRVIDISAESLPALAFTLWDYLVLVGRFGLGIIRCFFSFRSVEDVIWGFNVNLDLEMLPELEWQWLNFFFLKSLEFIPFSYLRLKVLILKSLFIGAFGMSKFFLPRELDLETSLPKQEKKLGALFLEILEVLTLGILHRFFSTKLAKLLIASYTFPKLYRMSFFPFKAKTLSDSDCFYSSVDVWSITVVSLFYLTLSKVSRFKF